MNRKLAKVLCIVSVWLVIWTSGCASSANTSSIALAQVGQQEISSIDISYMVAIEKAYGNEAVSDTAVLVGLINNSIESQVGRMCGVKVSADDLAALSRHADETSKAPEILAKIKEVFGEDRDAYERLYLGPKILNRKLRSWYSRNAEIHKNQRALIEKAYQLAQSGKSLELSAKDCGLDFSTGDYGKDAGEIPALLKQYMPNDSETASDPMMSILETMSEGEIYNNIVENDDGYKVIKLLGKKGSQYKVASISVRKQPFDKWFSKQAEQVKVKILDAVLRKKVVSKYPHVWWLKETHNETNQ
jgi:hypothetical protein